MNSAVSLPPAPASSTRVARATASPAPMWGTVLHLTRNELRRQWVLTGCFWWVALAAAVVRTQGVSDHLLIHYLTSLASIVLPVVITCRCIWPSSAARPELAIHTLPVGRWTLVLAQSLFLLLAVVLPWVLLDVCAMVGFAQDAADWWRVVLGSVLAVLVPVGLSAAWMSLARTRRQQGVIFLIALLVWWVLVLLVQQLNAGGTFSGIELILSEDALWTQSVVKRQVHLFGLGFLGLALWLLQTATRGCRLVFRTAVAGLVALLLIETMWSWNWLNRDDPVYAGGPLRVVAGEPAALVSEDRARLWPGLEITGLQRGEVAVVADFRPRTLTLSGGYADYEPRSPVDYLRGPYRVGVHADALRSIAGSLPEGWLCVDNGDTPSRPPLATVWKTMDQQPGEYWRSRGKDLTAPWKLRLSVIEPELVAEFPLRDVLKGQEKFLRPGVWMSLREQSPSRGFMDLEVVILRRRSALTPPTPRMISGAPWLDEAPQRLYLVLLNDAQRRAKVELSRPVAEDFVGSMGLSTVSTFYQGSMSVEAPTNRMKLTGLTREEWIAQTRVQIWWPRQKGFTELEIPAAEVKRLAGK